MSDSEETDGRGGRGKMLQRHKRELKALQEQKRIESGKLTSFAKAKREHKKLEARQEKRDLEEKFRVLEEELKQKHTEELKAVEDAVEEGQEEAGPTTLAESGYLDASGEGTRKTRLQKKKDLLAEIEKELREEGT
mmetsp:Transcript_23426/g.44096  ORF Transcript_23426/g.44096 Transcript_23426/m.44096 type:complete len:136 (-) Transcript_23426:254-661(-)